MQEEAFRVLSRVSGQNTRTKGDFLEILLNEYSIWFETPFFITLSVRRPI